MTTRPYRHLSGEDLRKRLKRADAVLGRAFDHLYLTDPTFKAALDLSLALEDEQAARKPSTTAISVLADIREVTGLGHRPMLSELAGAVAGVIAARDARIAELEAALTQPPKEA